MSLFAESCAFRITIAIITLIIVVPVAIANIVFFNKIRQNPTAEVSSTTAIWMIAVNAIVLILALALFIWALVGIYYYCSGPKTTTVSHTVVTPSVVPVPQVVEVPKVRKVVVQQPVYPSQNEFEMRTYIQECDTCGSRFIEE